MSNADDLGRREAAPLTSSVAAGGDVVEQLVDRLGRSSVVTDSDILLSYRFDRAAFVDAGHPVAVVFPGTTTQVAEVLALASATRTPVVTRGAGTGLTGACNAVDGGIVLSTGQLRSIREINVNDRLAVVEGGVVNATVSRAVAEAGLFYPPDPASWEESTIGGNIATNAGGLCCVRYGVTADYVRGLEVVLADGTVLHTGCRTIKGVAGYDLTRLLVGSEGTLGVVTAATLALRPRPVEPLTAVGFFSDLQDAGRAVRDIVVRGIELSLLELLDRETLLAVEAERRLGIPSWAAAMLLVSTDPGKPEHGLIDEAAAILRQAGARDVVVASDSDEARLLLEVRRAAGPAVDALGATLVDDVAVPCSALVELLEGIHRIAATHGLRIPVLGHAGDGNLHPTIVFDRNDEKSTAAATVAFGDILRLTLRLGGTITGEHGVGLLKKDWLSAEVGLASINLHRSIKRAFDPLGILNPGKMFEP